VALLSTEAEYRGAAVATCEAIWLKRLLKDLHEEVSNPTVIYSDNLSSIQLAKNPVFHAQTKHIEVHYLFVRERVLSGEVERHLHQASWSRQVAAILGCGRVTPPRRAELEGERRPRREKGKKGARVGSPRRRVDRTEKGGRVGSGRA
jgi:hypothetical protein